MEGDPTHWVDDENRRPKEVERHIRMLQRRPLENEQNSIFYGDSRLQSLGQIRNGIVNNPSNRLTRLTSLNEFNTAVDLDSDDDEAVSSNQLTSSRSLSSMVAKETTLMNIPSRHQENVADTSLQLTELQSSNPSKAQTSTISPILDRDRLVLSAQHHAIDTQSKSSSFSSTTALLILFVCYIIWQCFRSKRRKCLDDKWPTLLTPLKERFGPDRRKPPAEDGEGCEMQTVGTVRGTIAANDRPNNSAVLRLKSQSDNSQPQDGPEIEIIQIASANQSNCDATTTSGAKHTIKIQNRLRDGFMKNSLVVAANQAARPKVKLLGDKMRRYIEVEAGGDQGQYPDSLTGRLVRLLQTSGLFKKGDASSSGENQRDMAQDEHQSRQSVLVSVEQFSQNAERQTSEETIEVVVHQNTIETSSSDESLLGFAGSFLEPAVNSSCVGSSSSNSLLQQSLCAGHSQLHSHSNPQMLSASPMDKNQLDVVNDLISSCGCSLARSKSQTSQPYCQTRPMNQLITASPANIRPCCSVSPSAMNRHESINPSVHHHHHQQTLHQHLHKPPQQNCHSNQHLHNQHQPESSSCRPFVGSTINHSTVFCGKDRAKHHYENYYDDEQEDAYRRLTASIGAQFGLAIDQQSSLLPATSTVTCTMACKCNSAPSRHNIIYDGQMNDLSLGDSDSGNFSFVTKQRVTGDSICNDSNCSLCQSSLLTAPSQQTMDVFTTQTTGLDPISNLQGSLASRWHSRRRSTLYSRQPRRMSIAGVACQQSIAGGYGATQQHFLHRASIASDGANSFHHNHYHHNQNQLNARQIYPPSQFCANKKSNYSSSAGSSSGIGFSGSQCLNTPTTGTFPYQSFAIAKPLNDLIQGDSTIKPTQPTFSQTEPQTAWHVATTNDHRAPDGCHDQYDPSLYFTSRKFSLPVQLESKTVSNLTTVHDNETGLLFAPQQDDFLATHSPTPLKVAQPVNFEQTNDHLSHVVVNSINQKSTDQYRRSSQTITRQSSFWLEDSCPEPMTLTQISHLDSPGEANQTLGQQPEIDETGINNEIVDQEVRLISSSDSPQSPCDDDDRERLGASSSTTKGARYKIHHSSSSSTSSPSPDIQRRQRQRLRNRSTPSSSMKKKLLLGNLKHRRGLRQSSSHLGQRRSGSQTTNSISSQRQDTISTDDERGEKTKNDDSLSSFDREVAKAVSGRTILDINSTSLERQCRDLWKLRATLHDDALVGDNWSNYHQRLNRRYDSGYKSIENQFSSSMEGNVPNVLNLSLHQASVTIGSENNLREPGRPQSGCSGMIQERVEESSNDLVSSVLNEETQALLDNCDDQPDEQ